MKKVFMTESKTKSGYLMKSGFTLMELLIVIAIMVIVGGVSVFTFQKTKDRNTLANSAEQLKSLIMEAHADAMSPSDTETGKTVDSVKINITSNTFTSSYVRSNGSDLISTRQFPANINITGDTSFSFDTSGAATLGQITTGNNQVIKLSSGSATQTLTVDVLTGNITTTTATN